MAKIQNFPGAYFCLNFQTLKDHSWMDILTMAINGYKLLIFLKTFTIYSKNFYRYSLHRNIFHHKFSTVLIASIQSFKNQWDNDTKSNSKSALTSLIYMREYLWVSKTYVSINEPTQATMEFWEFPCFTRCL